MPASDGPQRLAVSRATAIALFVGAFLAGAAGRAAFPLRETGPRTESLHEPLAIQRQSTSDEPVTTGANSIEEPEPEEYLVEESAHLVAALPSPVEALGDRVLEGIVLDPEREPLAGISVSVFPDADAPGFRSTTDGLLARDFPRYLIDRSAEYRHRHDPRRRAVSGPDGRFRIEGLAPGWHYIEDIAEGVDFGVTVEGEVRSAFAPGEEIEVEVRLPCDVTVEVRSSDGALADRATVLVDDDLNHVWSAAASVIRVPAGWRTFRVYSEVVDHPQVTHWVRPGRVSPVVVFLETPEEERGVALTVHLPPGQPSPQLWIRWLALAPGELPSATRLDLNAHDSELFQEPEGESIEEQIPLPPGRYAIGIGWESDAVEVMASVDVSEGWNPLALTIPPRTEPDAIVVRTIGPDGAPIIDPNLHLYRRNFEKLYPDLVSTLDVRVSPGVTRMEILRDDEEPDSSATWSITAGSEEFGMRRVPVEGSEVEIRFENPASLTVELEGWTGQAGWPDGSGPIAILHSTDGGAEGNDDWAGSTLEFTRVQPGDYRLEVVRAELLAALDSIRLESGANSVVLPMPRLSALEVEIPRERLAWDFQLMRVDAGTRISRATRKGERRGSTLRYEDLPDGEYSLYADGRGSAEAMTIRIAGDARVRFRGSDRLAHLVRVMRESDADVGALRDGDLIVGLEGEEFASANEYLHLSLLLLEKDDQPWRMLVDRPGVGRIELGVSSNEYTFHHENRGPILLRVARD